MFQHWEYSEMYKLIFSLLIFASTSAYSKTYDCTQIGMFDVKLNEERLLTDKDIRGSLAFINEDPRSISMLYGKERTNMTLGLIDIRGNNTKIQSKGAMTTYRTYNLEKPLIVRVVDGVVIKNDNFIIIDIGTDAFFRKYGEYEKRFGCFDN